MCACVCVCACVRVCGVVPCRGHRCRCCRPPAPHYCGTVYILGGDTAVDSRKR
ncbi:hypothetical protein K505DRAFT_329058 [Melanomma pulvis-pyrius CBS 109.77]|uniref:Uncharacterized protein n=1 Tax=Melanomma pulvis-pyrius CBS 109.77 TaxID=1314802 RepID=A0A6A6WX15_9PLEO|nr:hypothetical protein K505DRAFT_329058 [Melanomma pulvis-pyrius CBS 109.77]